MIKKWHYVEHTAYYRVKRYPPYSKQGGYFFMFGQNLNLMTLPGRGRLFLCHGTNPPSQVSTCPVMKEAPSPARKATAAAMSSGVPRRPRGVCSTS